MPSDELHRDAWPRHAVPRPQDAALGALLLVESSHGQRALLQRTLTTHGFAVTAISALHQAAGALAAQPFEHAVLDLRLPDRDGLALLRSLRQTRPQARIVVVTDADSFATVVLALRAGADGFVPKPVEEGELIDALLDRAPRCRQYRRHPWVCTVPAGSM